MIIEEKLNDIHSRVTHLRKELHRYPEVSGNEFETAKRIENYLETHTKAQVYRIAETGVLAVFEGDTEGNTVLLRADTDALPIEERNAFQHRSTIAEVSHKCGHDGHTSILLGVAELLTEKRVLSGKILLLFQPAEENGMGAEAVLNDPVFLKWSIDHVFALHNLPGFKKHQIFCKDQSFTPNVKSIIIKLHGKTAHAAEPEHGQNPALAIADILYFANQNSNNQPHRDDFFLITPIHMHMGEIAYGISAGYGELHLTIRSWDLDIMQSKCDQLVAFIEDNSKKYGLKAEILWTAVFYANQNDKKAVHYVKAAAEKQELVYTEMPFPVKWGEDFGLFTQQYPGAMFGLGAGEETPALHHPYYDYPDDITFSGIRMFYEIIQQLIGLE